MLLLSLFENTNETILFGLFSVIIVFFLIIDLGVLNKNPRKISTRSAFYQSLFWVAISMLFGYLIYAFGEGGDASVTFFTAYLTEYALSVDNIFVILLILKYFSVKEEYYHNILFWGILGAILFRAIFIFFGAFVVSEFYWILYIFGGFLVYSGIKIYFEDDTDEIDPEKNYVLRLAKKYLNITSSSHGGHFVLRKNGKLLFTHLFLVVVLIETTDIIFAVDSIPAAFAITQNEFLIYTSNIFAVLGLRAKFFLLSGVLDRFRFLQKGLSFILVFIGAKMLLEMFDIKIDVAVSFLVILSALFISMIASLLTPDNSLNHNNIPKESERLKV